MTKLFWKSGLFLLLVATGLAPLCCLSLRADRAALNSSAFQEDQGITIVAAGDSHVETSVNPSLLSHSTNIALSAENYFFTYYKLRYFLQKNPQIQTVVLGFSPHNLTNHDSLLFEDTFKQSKTYFIVMDREARLKFLSFRLSYFVSFLKAEYGMPFGLLQNPILARALLGRCDYKRVDFLFNGGFKELTGTNRDPAKLASVISRHFYDNEQRYVGRSSVNTSSLYQIADLCRERGITLVLLNTPVAPSYRALIPPEATADFKQVLDEMIAKYPSIRHIDLSDLPLPMSDYLDGNHVNCDGAKGVTSFLSKALQEPSGRK